MTDWQRWIFRAICKHFQAMADDYAIKLFIEGTNRETKTKHLELRMHGPTITEVSHEYYTIDLEIHVKWSINMTDVDFYEQQRLAGAVMAVMSDICVLDDDGALWETLTQRRSNNNYLGQIATDSQVVQGTVIGYYEIKTGG